MTETLNLSGKGTASDFELETAAENIFNELRNFNSPKDAACAFLMAHRAMIMACFPPGFKNKAIEAVEAHCNTLKSILNDGWQ